jgi:hypothetical protein
VSVILQAPDGRDLKVNAWNWGVLHHLVEQAGIFPDDVWVPKRYNGGGALDADQVARLADFLAAEVVPLIGEGERMFFDGSITDVPDDGTFYRADDELWKNYSLRRDVLDAVIEFLRAASGNVIVH